MRQLMFHQLPMCFSYRGRVKLTKAMSGILFLIILTTALAACGSTATGQTKKTVQISPTPVVTLVPTPTSVPTRVPTPKPTPSPTPSPRPTVAPPPPPTQPPAPAPAILDLRPSSMSFVGHLDCSQNNGDYVCLARVISEANAQSNLNWFAYTNVPGGVSFSPQRGTLAPGQSVLVMVFVPLHACTPGLFFFQGPINTHTITWAC